MQKARAFFLIPLASLAFAFQPDPDILRKVYEDALLRRESVYGANDPRTAAAARDLGFFLREKGDLKAARVAFSRALQIDQANSGSESRVTLAGMIVLASVSPPVDAEALLRRVIAAPSLSSPLAVLALSTLGDLRQASGDRTGAAAYWRRALPHAESAFGQDSTEARNILNSLAPVVSARESVELMDRATMAARHSLGDDHPETATCEVNLAQALLRAGRNAEAGVRARQGLAIFETALGPQHPRVATAADILAEALRKQGKLREAEKYYRRALEIDRGAFGASDSRTRREATALTSLLRVSGRTREAQQLTREFPSSSK
jgi:tetratricopeptide (TPR) repeat protein